MTTRARVMTFNVRYDTATDGENSWSHRKELVASILRFHRPDVVGLQEPLAHQLEYLREALSEYRFVGAGRVDGADEGEYCPLGYRPERFELLEWGTEWLSETPETPGTSYEGAKKPRLATWGRFVEADSGGSGERGDRAEPKDSGEREDRVERRGGADSEAGSETGDEATPLVVCNTHFDHESAGARRRSAHQVRRLLDRLSGEAPAVLLGDFNCTPGSPPYRLIVGDEGAVRGGEPAGDVPASGSPSGEAPKRQREVEGPPLADAMAVSDHPHHGPTVTFERFDGDPSQKIDHVFVSDLSVRQHGILADHWDGRPPSDHLPVLAEVEY